MARANATKIDRAEKEVKTGPTSVGFFCPAHGAGGVEGKGNAPSKGIAGKIRGQLPGNARAGGRVGSRKSVRQSATNPAGGFSIDLAPTLRINALYEGLSSYITTY